MCHPLMNVFPYIDVYKRQTNCRITFNEITKTAVAEALEHPRTVDMNMVDAQQARRVLDRIVAVSYTHLDSPLPIRCRY